MRSLLLDEIKGLAIIGVVLFHLGVFAPGYLGVDVFLVIAGYLTAASVAHCKERRTFSAVDFLLKRIQRLMPLVLIGLVVSLIIGFFVMLPDDLENLSQAVIASVCFANNILCSISSRDYWAPNNDYKPLLHFWYLGVLMQLYVGYLLVASIKKGAKALLIGLSIVSALLWFAHIGQKSWQFYFMPWRFWEFGIGAILYDFGIRISPNWTIGIPGLASIGRMSLSIYIWHYIILGFERYVLCQTEDGLFYLVYVVCLIAISVVTYKYIEQSKASWMVNIRQGARIIVPAAIAVLVVAGWIELQSGIVRDVPELDIVVAHRERGTHSKYNDHIRQYNRDFTDNDKIKVLVVGNSWARDWANVLLESTISNRIDLSYVQMGSYGMTEFNGREHQADVIFLAGVMERDFSGALRNFLETGKQPDGLGKVYYVGHKYFGDSMGAIYSRRFRSDYFNTVIAVPANEIAENVECAKKYGDAFIDMIGVAAVRRNSDAVGVRVFSEDGKFLSQDCRHLTRSGAKFYAAQLDVKKLIEVK